MYNPSQYQQPYQQGLSTQKRAVPVTTANLNVKNPLVAQLKVLLEQKVSKGSRRVSPTKSTIQQQGTLVPLYPLTKQKIFTGAGRGYFILNSLFQSYKKKNQFKLLQQKVHKIQVYHIQRESQQQRKVQVSQFGVRQSIQSLNKVRVTPHIIFSSHQSQLSGRQIQKFIQMQAYIRPGVKNQLINQILKSVGNLVQVKDIMRCYQKLFTTKYCRQNQQLKELVEQKMIKKILSIDFTTQSQQGLSNNLSQITKSLLGFPSITQNILYFIGLLFDKVEDNLQQYQFLYKIMKNNFSFQMDNLQQAIQNIQNKKQIEALIKVNTKENNDLIKSLLRAYNKVKEKMIETDQKIIVNVLKIAQTEAHYKLVKLSSDYQKITLQTTQQLTLPPLTPPPLTLPPLTNPSLTPPPLTPPLQNAQQLPEIKIQQAPLSQKTQYTLKFITQVIKSGCNLWVQVNQWLKTTTAQQPKTFLLSQISSYLEKCLSDQKKIKTYILPHIKIIYQNVEETSQIYRLWMRHLVKEITDKTKVKEKYLNYNIVKKFIVKGITNLNNLAIFCDDIFQPSLLHADVLLDIFTLERQKSFTFYKQTLENQTYSKQFFAFLLVLKQKNPVKLKEWFILADQLKGGQLFQCSRYALIEFIKNNMKIELTFNWIRDLSIYPPSKFIVWILISLIAVFKQKKEFPALRNCIARSLNLILVRIPVIKLCDEFKKHLPSLAQQFKDFKADYDIIFADVSPQTLNQLKRAHIQSQGLKF